MYKRKFTVFTQLHEENNADMIEYFDDRRERYAKIVRKTFHAVKNFRRQKSTGCVKGIKGF